MNLDVAVRGALADLGFRHLPGQHNQESHGHGGGDLLGIADRIKLGDGEELVSSGSLDAGDADAEVVWAVTSTGEGRVARIAVLHSEAADEWDGTGDLTTTLDRDQVAALRGDLEEGAKTSKAYAAKINKLYDDGDVDEDLANDIYDDPIASGRTGDLRWEMYLDGMDPLSYQVSLHVGDDESDDGKTLEPKDLRKLLKKLGEIHDELGRSDEPRTHHPAIRSILRDLGFREGDP